MLSYFKKKAPCGAPLWQVEGTIFAFWLLGAMTAPVIISTIYNLSEPVWLTAPAIMVISYLLRQKNKKLFVFGAMAALIAGFFGIGALVQYLQ